MPQRINYLIIWNQNDGGDIKHRTPVSVDVNEVELRDAEKHYDKIITELKKIIKLRWPDSALYIQGVYKL